MKIDDNHLAESLRAAVSAFVRKTREGASTPSNAQSETLSLLEKNGPLSAAALARMRGVTHQSMRVIVAELREQGLLTTTQDAKDKRSTLFELNHKGQQALQELRLSRSRWLAENWVNTLSTEEREIMQQAIRLLNRIDV